MPSIEVLPNSSSVSAPGWAYVPDTGYDPSKAPIQPTARKRNARITGLAGGDTTVKQNNALLKRLGDLDKDNHKDVQISLPARVRDGGGRVSKGKTPATRKILLAQKTFANYIADEEALAAQEQHAPQAIRHRSSTTNLQRASSIQSLASSSPATSQTPSTSNQPAAVVLDGPQTELPSPGLKDPVLGDARLLQSSVPSAPSAALMEALINAPALSYNAARVGPSTSGRPQRHFCEICGYWGRVKCMKCGAKVCGLACKTAHDEGRCTNFYG
ncbi:MAG: hypothetical protein Q9187_004427 [Circinaria calcarea]